MDEWITRYDETPLREMTTPEVLENRARAIGDEIYIKYDREDVELSFADVFRIAKRIANSLRAMDIEPGARVATMMKNAKDTLVTMYGVNQAGCVFCPINHEYKGPTLRHQLDEVNPSVLFLANRYIDRFNEVAATLESKPRIVVTQNGGNGSSVDSSYSTRPYDEFLIDDTSKPPIDVGWDDTASIVFTSGTTGYPKGVRQPYRWLLGNTVLARHTFMDETDVVHVSRPLFHVTALYLDSVTALVSGSTVALWDRFSTSRFWDRIDAAGATVVSLSSVMVPWLTGQPEGKNDDENTLSKVNMTPLPNDYREVAERFGFDLISVVFGQTECGIPMTGLIHTDACSSEFRRGRDPIAVIRDAKRVGVEVVEDAPGERFMGRPLSFVEAAVVDDRDEPVPTGETGELVLRPKEPGVLDIEYYGAPRETLDVFRNLWYHTGDFVTRDAAGRYFFVGRKKEVIRRRGENISTAQLEDIANHHEMVEKTAAVPLQAEAGGEDEVGLAVQVGGPLDPEDYEEFLRENLASFMLPKKVVYLESFPETETGKVEKYKLLKKFD